LDVKDCDGLDSKASSTASASTAQREGRGCLEFFRNRRGGVVDTKAVDPPIRIHGKRYENVRHGEVLLMMSSHSSAGM
jgi:hypothetical protein